MKITQVRSEYRIMKQFHELATRWADNSHPPSIYLGISVDKPHFSSVIRQRRQNFKNKYLPPRSSGFPFHRSKSSSSLLLPLRTEANLMRSSATTVVVCLWLPMSSSKEPYISRPSTSTRVPKKERDRESRHFRVVRPVFFFVSMKHETGGVSGTVNISVAFYQSILGQLGLKNQHKNIALSLQGVNTLKQGFGGS